MQGESVNDYMKVPEGHIWLEGDNKEGSFDSRHHGPVSTQLIKGRVIYVLYPFKFISWIKIYYIDIECSYKEYKHNVMNMVE